MHPYPCKFLNAGNIRSRPSSTRSSPGASGRTAKGDSSRHHQLSRHVQRVVEVRHVFLRRSPTEELGIDIDVELIGRPGRHRSACGNSARTCNAAVCDPMVLQIWRMNAPVTSTPLQGILAIPPTQHEKPAINQAFLISFTPPSHTGTVAVGFRRRAPGSWRAPWRAI
jgi:hypothetical protein